jgi:Dolichyl-phosphate-mannose-protein mannosyltransferase
MPGRGAAWSAIERRELIVLAALLALGALLLSRHLGSPSLEFDEGVYLVSADLLGRGFDLGRDVFSSQPPLFLTLLDGANRVAGGSLAALHGMTVGVALAGAVAGWAIVRGIAGPFPALAAVALVVLAPGVVDAAAVVSADVPSVALGTGALLAARAARAARHRPAWGAVAGALICSALLVKLLAAPFAVALAVGAVVERPPRRTLAWFATGALASSRSSRSPMPACSASFGTTRWSSTSMRGRARSTSRAPRSPRRWR